MKKFLILIFFIITAFNSAFALSPSFQKDASMQPVPCQAITNAGWGSYFQSLDKSMDASLYYLAPSSGVSGGFGAVLNGVHLSAPLIDSQCHLNIVTLNWSTSTFKGHLEGNLTNQGIVNLKGDINGTPVSGATLIYKGRPS